MEKEDPTIEVENDETETKLLPVSIELFGAPQPSLSTPIDTAWDVDAQNDLTGSNTARLDRMYIRQNQMEAALIRLGAIKGTFGG